MALLAIVLVMGGCTKAPESKESAQEKRELLTHVVTSQEVPGHIEATGTIQPDVEGTVKVVTYLAGTVEKIFVKVGDKVNKGNPLVVIRSADVSDTYSNYLANLSQIRQAERIYGLNKQLFEVGAVTKNDLLNSEANYEQVKAQSEALKKKLEIYGVSPESGFTDKHTINSPMEGSVVEIQVHLGDRVDSSNALMTVADPKKVMVVANIYDTDIANVQKGKEVTFTTDIFPNMRFKGLIKYVSDASDSEAKTVKTYIQILTEQHLFKQNMFLRINIYDGKKRLPIVPKSALLYKDGKFSVYIKEGEKLIPKEVKPEINISDKLMAVDGIKEGDVIVLSAIEMEKT
jgi:RND family efflux transporter MFP subunit